MMKVSVIIATFRRGSNLLTVLNDLKDVKYENLEIIVVDQTPKDEYPTEIYTALKNLSYSGLFRWIEYPRNYVYEARNYGAAVSTGDLLLWLDDDVRVGSDLVERFMNVFRENPEVSIIQGSAVSEEIFNEVITQNTNKNLQAQIDIATATSNRTRRNLDGQASQLLKLKPELQAFYYEGGFNRSVKNCTWVSANNMMIKRSTFEAINGWDEYILNYGDRNLGVRAAKAGFQIHWYPDASIVHLRVKSGGSRMSDPNNPIQGWRACVSIWYLAFRYLKFHPIAFYKFGIFKAARYSFLLKKNFLSFDGLSSNLLYYLMGALIGFRWSFNQPLSSYNKWRQEFLSKNIIPDPTPVPRTPE